MQSLNNLASFFHLNGSNGTMLVALRPDSAMERAIDAAEQLIRRTLGEQLPDRLKQELPPQTRVPKPKFLRQGSRAYDTINDPIRDSLNYNEADSDIGLYLPLEFVKESAATPKLGAQALRALVEASLMALAKDNGWRVKAKPCCIRVYVRHDAHIDVTCYAIPELQYRAMAMEAASLRKALDAAFSAAEEVEDEISWDEIPATAHLATQSGWIRSDAKAIHQKIENTYALKGPIFKRVVRFIKALRDYCDDKDGPYSIAITLIVADHLDLRLCRLARDDLAVYSMLGIIADGLFRPLPTPGNEDVDILAGVSTETRTRLATFLRDCAEVMRQALYDLPVDRAQRALANIFGDRFPVRPVPAEPAVITAAPAILSRSAPKSVAPRGNARSS